MYLLLLATNYQNSSSQVSVTTNVVVNSALMAEYMVLEYITHKEIQNKLLFLKRIIASADTPARFKDALKLMEK